MELCKKYIMILEKIPSELHHLIPLAEKWGIGDDAERDIRVTDSSKEELIELVNSVSDEDAESLDKWLAGPEAAHPPFTPEYETFTCFLMARDYARAILKDKI